MLDYKKILTEKDLSQLLSKAEANKNSPERIKRIINQTLSNLESPEGFQQMLSDTDKNKISEVILNVVTNHQNELAVFVRSILDKIEILKDVPGFKELYVLLKENESILKNQSVGKATEKHLEDILKALELEPLLEKKLERTPTHKIKLVFELDRLNTERYI